jgi:hypothetical protein
MTLHSPGVRSPYDQVGGIVYFGRMIDKIRRFAEGTLHPELQDNLGQGFDERATSFLGIDYPALKEKVLHGLPDDEVLAWCFLQGRKPSDEQIEIWNEFMRKRGWQDAATPTLLRRLREGGWENRTDIQTMFDFIDLDEGRDPALKKT